MEQGTISLYEILGERSTSLCQSAEKNVVKNEEVKVSGEFIQSAKLFHTLFIPGLSIIQFWGRNSAPFPMPKSMFFSQFQIKNSHFDIFLGGRGEGGFSTFISYNINTEHIVTY